MNDQQTFSNESLWKAAQRVLVGGVNSPVRSFASVGLSPLPVKAGRGAYLIDAEGNEYIDMVCSWGAQIVGHADPEVSSRVCKAAAQGLGFGALHPAEVALADLLLAQVQGEDLRVRFVSSGTEAAMTALRLARGATGRSKILKFDGGYHGHSDPLLVAGGSGLATLAISSSAGVPKEAVQHTVSVPFNDLQSVSDALENGEFAAVIVESICGNMGMVEPRADFHKELRSLCDAADTLLIADEVMTGFRAADGAVIGEIYGVQPDITVFGKVIGGGLPVAAFVGTASLMEHLAPLGDVYQAGTLSGNPVAMAAGIATLEALKEAGGAPVLHRRSQRIVREIEAMAQRKGLPLCALSRGGILGLFFAENLPSNQKEVGATDLKAYVRLFSLLLEQGVMLPPSPWESSFIGLAHDDEVITRLLEAFEASLANL